MSEKIIENRAIYEDYNFQFLKKDVACKNCQYYEDEKCNNTTGCFWITLEKKLKALEIIKKIVNKSISEWGNVDFNINDYPLLKEVLENE